MRTPTALAAAAVAALAGGAAAQACYPGCRFTFCPEAASPYKVGVATDTPFTPPICDGAGGVAVGHVDATAEAYHVVGSGVEKISAWAPGGLSQPFSGSFFKSFGFPPAPTRRASRAI
jgi:hypothetical protein